jgi:hypothetical protein
MNRRRILYSLLAVAFGTCIVVYGGYDDSPGGQLLGLVVVMLGIVGVIKSKKKNPKKPSYGNNRPRYRT